MDLPKDLQEFVARIYCPRCMTPTGRGFTVSATPDDAPQMWTLVGRCLRCGFMAVAKFKSDAPPPSPPLLPVAPEISSDEVLDLHEALKSDDWLAQLTGGRKE